VFFIFRLSFGFKRFFVIKVIIKIMITREKKQIILQDITDKFSKAKTVVFIGFQGLTAKDNLALRRKFREEGIDLRVAKKTLIQKGLASVNVKGAEELSLDGSVAVAVGYDDEVAPARIAKEFGKTNDKISILGGVMNFELVGAENMKQIASLPGKDQLRGQLVGTINAPVSGFVNVLAGNLRGLVNVLEAISKEKK
jgi:large subunit ribosomal protein L10